MAKRITVKRIEEALAEAGFENITVCKTGDSWYFVAMDYDKDSRVHGWYETSLGVYSLNHMGDVESIINLAKDFDKTISARITGGGRALNLGKFSDESEGEPFCEAFCETNTKIIRDELKKKLKKLNPNLIQF